MLQAENLVFDYPDKRALHGVSLTIARGEIVALVGPNGAGKSTLIRCLIALSRPGSGRVLMNGQDVHQAPRDAHRSIGYLGDFVGLYDGLSARRCLYHAAAAAGVPKPERRAALQRAAERLGLMDHFDALVGQLSRGQRQRVAIAQAIIHQPDLLVLDEPAAGLDPEARSRLSALILKLRDDGTTILVSSHILAELEDYCTKMLMIDDGRLIDTQPLEPPRHRFHVRLATPRADLSALVAKLPGVAAVSSTDGSEAIVTLEGEDPKPQDLLAALVSAGLPVCAFGPEQWRLQDSYLAALDARATPGGPTQGAGPGDGA
jgi:ABC-2 type transport system ATP-binding protein